MKEKAAEEQQKQDQNESLKENLVMMRKRKLTCPMPVLNKKHSYQKIKYISPNNRALSDVGFKILANWLVKVSQLK